MNVLFVFLGALTEADPWAPAVLVDELESRKLEQAHICIASEGLPYSHKDRFGIYAMNTLLGSSMSSRLFQVIREQLGLAYSIYSFLSFFSDTGLLGVSAGVSPKNLEALLAAVWRELSRVKAETVSAAELQAAREYLRGSIYLGAEDVDHLMMRLAKNEINFGHYIPLDDIVAGLLKVTAAEIQEMARELLQPGNWALTFLGPTPSILIFSTWATGSNIGPRAFERIQTRSSASWKRKSHWRPRSGRSLSIHVIRNGTERPGFTSL